MHGNKANEIVPGLWIGEYHAALDPNFLKKYKIGAIVNCTPDVEMPYKNIDYYHVPINDTLKKKDFQEMIRYLPGAVEFIKQKRDKEGKNVLVHCHVGRQRSCCVATAYLSLRYKLTIRDTVALILKRRPVAFHDGNHVNFIESLMYYCEKPKKTVAKSVKKG